MTQYTSPDNIPVTEITDIIASSTENLRLRMNAIAVATQQGLDASRQTIATGDATTLQAAKDDATTRFGGIPARVTAVEQKNTQQDGAIVAAESNANAYTNTRESAIRADFATSHLALDVDGTPYFERGSMTLRVLQDTDGVLYYEAA